jgi:hypothetical protein
MIKDFERIDRAVLATDVTDHIEQLEAALANYSGRVTHCPTGKPPKRTRSCVPFGDNSGIRQLLWPGDRDRYRLGELYGAVQDKGNHQSF